MRVLLMRAIIGAAGSAAVEAVVVSAFGCSLPLWTMIALPCGAGLAVFLIAGRLRALRRQRSRRRVSSLPSHQARVLDLYHQVVRSSHPYRSVHVDRNSSTAERPLSRGNSNSNRSLATRWAQPLDAVDGVAKLRLFEPRPRDSPSIDVPSQAPARSLESQLPICQATAFISRKAARPQRYRPLGGSPDAELIELGGSVHEYLRKAA